MGSRQARSSSRTATSARSIRTDRTIAISAEAFNLYRSDGSVIIELIPSGPVGECVQSFARVRLEYPTLPDCDSDGTWDGCQLASDPNVDCNANGILDSCERYTPSHRDCNGNGLFDECEIASDPSLDKNGDGIIDACNYACGDFGLWTA